MIDELENLRPEVRSALGAMVRADVCRDSVPTDAFDIIRAELLRLADENARLNKIESLATEQRLQMEDVELYLVDVSQPDDEDAPWCDRMKSAIELLVQDCNYAVGQKNKAEAEITGHKHCDSCGCTWLDNGLNPTHCPYCEIADLRCDKLNNEAMRAEANDRTDAACERADSAEAELAEMKQTFDLRWKADMRAIEQWRVSHPGSELVMPDHADMCTWLMSELATAQNTINAQQDTMGALKRKLALSEGELAAFKERIAVSPVVTCPKTLVHAGNTMQTEFLEYTHECIPGGCNRWAGKRVRLVVEE